MTQDSKCGVHVKITKKTPIEYFEKENINKKKIRKLNIIFV